MESHRASRFSAFWVACTQPARPRDTELFYVLMRHTQNVCVCGWWGCAGCFISTIVFSFLWVFLLFMMIPDNLFMLIPWGLSLLFVVSAVSHSWWLVSSRICWSLIVGSMLGLPLCKSCGLRLRMCSSREDVHPFWSGPREYLRFRVGRIMAPPNIFHILILGIYECVNLTW